MENSAVLIHNIHMQVLSLLPKQCCTLENVARSLAFNPRTLQRHLAALGIAFEDYVDDIRRVQAENFLHHSDLRLEQISRLLGYVQTTSFCRAYKRWFAASPIEHRRCIRNSNS